MKKNKVILAIFMILLFSCSDNISDEYFNNKSKIDTAIEILDKSLKKTSEVYVFPKHFSFPKDMEEEMDNNHILLLAYKKNIIPYKLSINDFQDKVDIGKFKDFLNHYYKNENSNIYLLDKNLIGLEFENINNLFFQIETLNGSDLDVVSNSIDRILTRDFINSDFFIPVYDKKFLNYFIDMTTKTSVDKNSSIYRGRYGIGRLQNKKLLAIDLKVDNLTSYRILLEIK